MIRSAAKQRSIELGWIHRAAADLGLRKTGDDAAYRDMLFAVARVRSAADLDQGGRRAVLDHLRQLGWVSKPRRPGGVPRRRGQAGFIQMLWIRIYQAGGVTDGSEGALRAYVRRQSASFHPQGVGYDSPELLPDDVAARVIESMKRWAKRLGVSW